MWNPEHRLAADRRGLRYPSDLTDAEWAIVAAMIPPGRHGGRRRSVNVCCKRSSENGQLLVGFQSTEAFGCLHHAGGGPAQRHRGISPSLHVAADATHGPHHVLN